MNESVRFEDKVVIITGAGGGLVGNVPRMLPEGMRAVGMLTCTSDDALYVALDEGTKAAPVEKLSNQEYWCSAE